MRRIWIFCGSYSGVRTECAAASRAMAAALVRGGVELVYGGGRVGLMGILADEVLRLGGTAVGVVYYTRLFKEHAQALRVGCGANYRRKEE